MSLPIGTRVKCRLTDKLGVTVLPLPPRGMERVQWDDYQGEPVLQWTTLLLWSVTPETRDADPYAQ
jgi:hypothetical protein